MDRAPLDTMQPGFWEPHFAEKEALEFERGVSFSGHETLELESYASQNILGKGSLVPLHGSFCAPASQHFAIGDYQVRVDDHLKFDGIHLPWRTRLATIPPDLLQTPAMPRVQQPWRAGQ